MGDYDANDMKEKYYIGFWTGAISGFVTAFTVCLLAGLYFAA